MPQFVLSATVLIISSLKCFRQLGLSTVLWLGNLDLERYFGLRLPYPIICDNDGKSEGGE